MIPQDVDVVVTGRSTACSLSSKFIYWLLLLKSERKIQDRKIIIWSCTVDDTVWVSNLQSSNVFMIWRLAIILRNRILFPATNSCFQPRFMTGFFNVRALVDVSTECSVTLELDNLKLYEARWWDEGKHPFSSRVRTSVESFLGWRALIP